MTSISRPDGRHKRAQFCSGCCVNGHHQLHLRHGAIRGGFAVAAFGAWWSGSGSAIWGEAQYTFLITHEPHGWRHLCVGLLRLCELLASQHRS